MVKNLKGGTGTKGLARKHQKTNNNGHVRVPECDGEVFAYVSSMLGNGMCEIYLNSKDRLIGHIRNKFRGRQKRFMVNHARDNPFVSGGLRVYREYRDLGIAATTGGKVHAHIIRTTKPCPEGGSGLHYHDVDFQMVMVLKGRSRVWFEGEGEVEFEEGDCWIQPPGIKHNVLYYSEDYELLELTLPEKYETVQVQE